MAFAVQIAKGIFDLVREDLALVEQEIAAQNGAAIEPVCEISSYLREGGGKRVRPSANARWGNHMSVLAGDWLYMQSFEMALRERNFAVLDILIDLTQNMVEGELLQLTRLGQIDLNEAEATELAYRKTACLFSG